MPLTKYNAIPPQTVPDDVRAMSDDLLAVRLDAWSYRLERWRGFLREIDDPRGDPHGDRRALFTAGVEAAERHVWRLQNELCRRGAQECPSK